MQRQKEMRQRDADGEFENTKGKNHAQILAQNKKQFEDQDKALDKISDVVGIIKFENEGFKQEVNLQNKMLDQVNDDIE